MPTTCWPAEPTLQICDHLQALTPNVCNSPVHEENHASDGKQRRAQATCEPEDTNSNRPKGPGMDGANPEKNAVAEQLIPQQIRTQKFTRIRIKEQVARFVGFASVSFVDDEPDGLIRTFRKKHSRDRVIRRLLPHRGKEA